MMARVTLYIVSVACAMSLGGCQFSGAAGQIEQQLPGVLTATETIAVNTLILRYQELQRLKMVLDGVPVPLLPPLPPPVPSPPPPGPPPVVVTPVPGIPGTFPPSPPVTPSLRHQRAFPVRGEGWPSFEQLAAEPRQSFWVEHRPSFRLVAGTKGIAADPLVP